MTKTNENATASADREIVMTRLIDAPQDLVFSAFKDPRHISNWGAERLHDDNLRNGCAPRRPMAFHDARS
jgi:uncharacterized protein YndB with AHSA1/START domain